MEQGTYFTLIDKVEVGRFPPYLLAVRNFFVILHEILTTKPTLMTAITKYSYKAVGEIVREL